MLGVLPRPVAMTARKLRRSTKWCACKKETSKRNRKFFVRKSHMVDFRIMGGKNSVLFSFAVFFFNGFSLWSFSLYVRTASTGL